MNIDIRKKRFAVFVLALAALFAAYGAQAQSSTDLTRFEQAGMIAEADLDNAIAAGEIGTRAEEAVVPLFFDHDGNLLDAETYNRLIDEGMLEQNISKTTYTDFSTYKAVMQEKASLGLKHQAIEDIDLKYVHTFAMSDFSTEAGVVQTQPSAEEAKQILYMYDAYATFYSTEEDMFQELEEQLESSDSLLPTPPSPPDSDSD